jgi:hypothetical protein
MVRYRQFIHVLMHKSNTERDNNSQVSKNDIIFFVEWKREVEDNGGTGRERQNGIVILSRQQSPKV